MLQTGPKMFTSDAQVLHQNKNVNCDWNITFVMKLKCINFGSNSLETFLFFFFFYFFMLYKMQQHSDVVSDVHYCFKVWGWSIFFMFLK